MPPAPHYDRARRPIAGPCTPHAHVDPLSVDATKLGCAKKSIAQGGRRTHHSSVVSPSGSVLRLACLAATPMFHTPDVWSLTSQYDLFCISGALPIAAPAPQSRVPPLTSTTCSPLCVWSRRTCDARRKSVSNRIAVKLHVDETAPRREPQTSVVDSPREEGVRSVSRAPWDWHRT